MERYENPVDYVRDKMSEWMQDRVDKGYSHANGTYEISGENITLKAFDAPAGWSVTGKLRGGYLTLNFRDSSGIYGEYDLDMVFLTCGGPIPGYRPELGATPGGVDGIYRYVRGDEITDWGYIQISNGQLTFDARSEWPDNHAIVVRGPYTLEPDGHIKVVNGEYGARSTWGVTNCYYWDGDKSVWLCTADGRVTSQEYRKR